MLLYSLRMLLHRNDQDSDTSSQYGDHFCPTVVKSDFKSQSYGPDAILPQGHAVTLTFKVATQILLVRFVHIAGNGYHIQYIILFPRLACSFVCPSVKLFVEIRSIL